MARLFAAPRARGTRPLQWGRWDGDGPRPRAIWDGLNSGLSAQCRARTLLARTGQVTWMAAPQE